MVTVGSSIVIRRIRRGRIRGLGLRIAQEEGHPNGTNSAPPILLDDPPIAGEEHWAIRRWVSDYAGEGSIVSQLRSSNGSGSGTSVYLYQNGNLLDTLSTNTVAGVTNTVNVAFAVDDIFDFALSPVGVDGNRADGSDSSLFRMTATDEPYDPPDPPPAPFADSLADWSSTGTQGEKNWFNGYYNLTQDGDGEYQVEDFQPFLNDGSGVPETDPVEVNHWNGTAYDFEGNPPWTFMSSTGTHPNGTNNGDEHWTVRRWVADDLTSTKPLELTWMMAKTNLANDGVTGKLFVNGEEVDGATIGGADGTGVTRKFYINAEPGDVIDLALTPVGLTNGTDGNDGSSNQLTVRTELPDGPLFNPGEVIADSRAEFSEEQGQDNWFYGYYDQRLDVEEGDAEYGLDDFIALENDGSGVVSVDDETDAWKEWGNYWDSGANKWDLLNNGTVAHGPWTEITQAGGHPGANGQADPSVHWSVRRWISDVEGDVNIDGLLHNTSASGDGTVGRIFLDGEEVWSEATNGTTVPVDLDLTLNEGSVIDFAIDPDGSGNFDPEDPLNTLGLIQDGSDGTSFYFRLQQLVLFEPIPGLTGDYNGNGELDVEDLDLQAVEIAGGLDPPAFDLTGDGFVNEADRIFWLHDLKGTWVGDADLNGLFDSGDFVAVFVEGLYETGEAAGWAQGDWNADLVFDSGDFVAAFIDGGYEIGAFPGAVQAVPEPSCVVLTLLGLLSLIGWVRRR